MRKIPLGHTGEQVSALCLGAMYFGTSNDKTTSYRMLDQYAAAGGSFIDTANIYAHWVPGGAGGESETLLGEWMQERGNRAQLFIASKVGFQYPGVSRGLTRQQIIEECEKSLRRLNVDTIDLYYAHVDDRNTPLAETIEAFSSLVKAGKVRWIGASNYSAWRLERVRQMTKSDTNDLGLFCCVQQRYTYLRPRAGTTFNPQLAANDDLIEYCADTGLTLLAYSALLGGAYTRPERSLSQQYVGADSDARLATLRSVAADTGATANQVILAWMLQGDPVVLPLIAASTSEQMQENIGALDVRLSVEQRERLNNAGV